MQAKAGDSVMICGGLPRDAEFKTVGEKSSSLTKFSVKVGERDIGADQREAIWCNCICWNKVADLTKKLKKGDIVFAIGKLQQRSYTDREGDEKTVRELVCESVFRMSPSEDAGDSGKANAGLDLNDFPELDDDDDTDLPF